MKTIQLLKTTDYWTQLKNLDTPIYECQVTSGANYLNAGGIYPYTGKYRLPDVIDDMAMGAIAKSWAKAQNYDGPPRELHDILSWAINVIANEEIDEFSPNATLQEIVFEISQHRPVIVAGKFTGEGHVVCATGLITQQEDIESVTDVQQVRMDQIQSILIADPYGDWHTKNPSTGKPYAPGSSGYECKFTIAELMDLLHNSGSEEKWVHRMKK